MQKKINFKTTQKKYLYKKSQGIDYQKSLNHKPIYIVIGTRAQLIKTAPVMIELTKRNIAYTFIYTAQHIETIDEILKDFRLKKPDIVLFESQETKSLGLFGKWLLKAIWSLFIKKDKLIPIPGLLITHGDTTSCVWGAILGKISGCQVMHLESGLRSFNLIKPFPEEINRLITFHLTDIYVCPNQWAINNLKKYKGIKINTMENTLYDSVRFAIKKKPNLNIKLPSKYIVTSIHRFENIFNKEQLRIIIDLIAIASQKMPVIFVLHPTTKRQLYKTGLIQKLKNAKNIITINRLPFSCFINLINKAELVITDGGSNQEELSYLGKPTIILRDTTERIEGLGKNAKLIKFNQDEFVNFLNNYKEYQHKPKKVTISPSKIIVNWIINNYLLDTQEFSSN